jgi:uncharacterized protein (UPF0332 family)
MDSKAEMFLKRARSELDSAEILAEVSNKKELKDTFKVMDDATFYSGAISHAYYCIFYCAKAMLLTNRIETEAPEIHKKTFDAFKKSFIDTGIMDVKLLLIYKQMIVRAEALLEIYKQEKKKRGDFTYNTIPQANKEPAEESIKNAKEFYKHCNAYMSAEHQ